MTFQKLDNNDIQILTELFTHPLNFVDRKRISKTRYFRYFLWGVIGLFLFPFLIRNLGNNTPLSTYGLIHNIIEIIVIVMCSCYLTLLYFCLYVYKKTPEILKKRFQTEPVKIIDNHFSYHKWNVPFDQIKLIRFYHGCYFIYSEKVTLITKPVNISYEEFKNYFSQYPDIIYETYEEPFQIKTKKEKH